MKKWLKLGLSLVGSIFALLLAKWVNIFSYMSSIPNDKQYDVCIAVYFNLIETAITIIFERIEKIIEKNKTKIFSIIHIKNEEPNLNSAPVIRFNEMGMAEFFLHIKMSGKCKKMIGKKIVIQSFVQGDMQIGRRGSGVIIDNMGNLVIDLEQICGSREYLNFEEDYRITLQRGLIDNSGSVVLKPELISDGRCCGVKHNKNTVKISWEEK